MKKMKNNLPENVLYIMKRLSQNGYESFVVGGSLRNLLLGEEPKDFDMTTNATPEEILRIFADCKTFDNGLKHGTVSIVFDGEVYEVTTYRIDGEYLDNRHPKEVRFTDNIKEDLSRRDFTVNAIAYNPKIGIVDYFNGEEDIKCRCIRCVGNADERMKEDALRVLRALRFASVYNFTIEPQTEQAIFNNMELLKNISYERISTELKGILIGQNVGYVLKKFCDVFAVFIPELKPMFGFNQNNPHHDKNLWEHTVCAVQNVENKPLLRTVMLFHDICKPQAQTIDKNGVSHFHNHDKMGSETVKMILKRLKFSKKFTETASMLIYYHDTRISADKPSVKKLLNILNEENFRLLMKIQYADIMAQSQYKRTQKITVHSKVNSLFEEIIRNNECYTLKQLAVNGRDLFTIGIQKGDIIGKILNELLELVINGKLKNEKKELLAYIKKQAVSE